MYNFCALVQLTSNAADELNGMVQADYMTLLQQTIQATVKESLSETTRELQYQHKAMRQTVAELKEMVQSSRCRQGDSVCYSDAQSLTTDGGVATTQLLRNASSAYRKNTAAKPLLSVNEALAVMHSLGHSQATVSELRLYIRTSSPRVLGEDDFMDFLVSWLRCYFEEQLSEESHSKLPLEKVPVLLKRLFSDAQLQDNENRMTLVDRDESGGISFNEFIVLVDDLYPKDDEEQRSMDTSISSGVLKID